MAVDTTLITRFTQAGEDPDVDDNRRDFAADIKGIQGQAVGALSQLERLVATTNQQVAVMRGRIDADDGTYTEKHVLKVRAVKAELLARTQALVAGIEAIDL